MKDITLRLNKCISILESAEERSEWSYVRDVIKMLHNITAELAQTTTSIDETSDIMTPDLPIEIRQLKAMEKIAETMVKMEKSLDSLTQRPVK